MVRLRSGSAITKRCYQSGQSVVVGDILGHSQRDRLGKIGVPLTQNFRDLVVCPARHEFGKQVVGDGCGHRVPAAFAAHRMQRLAKIAASEQVERRGRDVGIDEQGTCCLDSS